jgi:4'-phosphopantetheinyl transferase
MHPSRHGPGSSALLEVWRVFLPAAVNHFAMNIALLDSSERRRADCFHFERDRQRFVASHAALRLILGRALSVQPQAIRYALESSGKPRLDDAQASSGIRFNLSHSGEWALIALSARTPEISLGIDLEVFDPDCPPPLEVIPSFSVDEQHAMKGLVGPELATAFYRCWTRKEALVKALGTGIGDGLSLFTVCAGETAMLIDSKHPRLQPSQWAMTSLDRAGAYAAALAVKGGDGLPPLEYDWAWDQIA